VIFAENNNIPVPKFIYPIEIDSDNKYLDFAEGALEPERSAEIDAGWYLPDELATAVQTALNAVTAASGDYTVSYSRTTDKFTIETDQAYLDLLWSTGSNAASGCHTSLGFASGADDTGATSYAADNMLPNRFASGQPVRSPEHGFPWIRKEFVSDSGRTAVNFRRQERELSFTMSYIREQDLKDDWVPMLVASGVARGHAVDFYPNSLDTATYVRAYLDQKGFDPKEMVGQAMPRFYSFKISLREKIPAAGSVSIEDLFTRSV